MSVHESHAFRPQPDEHQSNISKWHLELMPAVEQRRSPGGVIERAGDEVRRNVEQEVKQSVRDQQAALKAARERAEISATLLGSFEIIDGSNRAHKRDGKITRDEILNFRRDHSTELTSSELRNLQVASRDFATQIGRGKDWATRADVETYRVSPPVVVRRPQGSHDNEGIDDKIKNGVGKVWKGIRKRVGD